MKSLRRIFFYLNKYFMVPVFRMGLGRFIGNPFSGYIMVLKTIGRKSGLTRYAPVNYAILDGHIYCLSGFGKKAHWYRNLSTNPQINLILPSATISGRAETVTNTDEWLRTVRQILKNSGFATFFSGINPFTISGEDLKEKAKEMVVIRIAPNGIYAGYADPGGKLWIWLTVFVIALIIIFIKC